jgi:hypothetical protein
VIILVGGTSGVAEGEVLEEVADYVASKFGECESDRGTFGLG